MQKKALKIYVVMILTLTIKTFAWAGTATLSWNPNTESDLAGYKVYFGTVSSTYTQSVDVGLTSTPATPQYILNNLVEGNTYFFTITAYDTSGNQSGYSNEANNFDGTYAYATLGIDKAVLYDSLGDDMYVAWWNRTVLYGSGFWNDARGFDRTTAYSSQGNDQAVFYDSAGDDVYGGWSNNRALMYGSGYFNDSYGFNSTVAYTTTGYDRAYLYSSNGDDRVEALAWGAFMSGTNYRNEVRGFDWVRAEDNRPGNDTAFVDTIDYVFELAGAWG